MRAIGLMSGTSMDGIDIAAIETDGETITRFGPSALHFYQEHEEAAIRRAMEAAVGLRSRDERPPLIAQAEMISTALHAGAVNTFLDMNKIDRASIHVVGFHGQTVLHRPAEKLTVQIGNGAQLAVETGLTVVYDFRAADIAAGGQGAPLVPVFHRALARSLARPHPIAVLNLGGVANITFIDGDADPIACDTGPANALIDDFMRARNGATHDEEGRAAAAGTVDAAAVAKLLTHPFFAQPSPKSLDRNDFRAWVAAHAGLEAKSVQDGAATLTALTAASVARVVEILPRAPKSWIIAGGGARNPTLVRMLRERLGAATVETAGQVGWSADALEAQAFAYLAVRSLKGLPLTFPSSTGVPRPMRGGVLVRP
ncbi:MAG: anhydro-N-acetylmuramic acid kinase [Alphaproteobacteria bacterium]|nr:anhydro-N-acetylmuramic acid kinase [Alphaproteobacteria bacterium]